LDDDVVKGLYGDQKNIGNTAGLLKPALGIPPEEYDKLAIVDPSLRRRWKRRGERGKLGILDIRLITKTGRIVDVEIQVRPHKLMIPRLVFYHAMMIAEQMKAGFEYDRIHQTITVLITDHILLPDEPDYMNTIELRNSKTGRLSTDLQKYVILELPKVPAEDDGSPIWPQLQFLKCKAKEDMKLLLEKHPEVQPLVADFVHMTWSEKRRKRAEYREKDRRDEWAIREYIKDEGRDEGRVEGRAEKQKELEAKDRENQELKRKLREAGIE
jgi:predicted transposase/invertase (TIGR01784 family)